MLACNEFNIEEKDLLYFIPIFHFYDSRIPIELGEWTGNITIYDSSKKNISNGTPPETIQNAKITFSNSNVPEEVKDIDCFTKFKYVKASVESQEWPESIEKDGSTIVICVKLTNPGHNRELALFKTNEIILVKAEEVFRLFFEKYKIGVCPLAYFYSATPLAGYRYITQRMRSLIKNQFGMDVANVCNCHKPSFYLENLNGREVEKYISLEHVLAMYAFVQVHQKRKFSLPNNEVAIIFEKDTQISEEKLELMFFDKGFPLEDKKLLLTAHPSYSDKLKDIIFLMKRKSGELAEAFQLSKQNQIKPRNGFRTPPKNKHDTILTKHVKEIAENPNEKMKDIAREIQESYIQLTNIAARSKESILNKISRKNVVDIQVKEHYEQAPNLRENFIILPGNTEGLWPHFAALPSGYCRDFSISKDEEHGESISITRQVLEHKKQFIGQQYASLIIPLEKVSVEDIEKEEKIECVNLLLDTGQCPGYIIQAIIAISKLIRDLGGLEYQGKMIRIYYDAFIDVLRPNREKRSRALGVNKDEKAFFRAIIELLNVFYYKRTYKPTYEKTSKKPLNNWEEIRGLFHIDKRGENKDEPYYDIHFNQSLYKLMDASADNPLFLQSNAKAVLSLPEQSLDYAPAAQLSLETLARVNLYGKDRNTLLFGRKGYESGITRKALIHRFGLLKGNGDNMSHVLKKLDRTLDTLKDQNVISTVKINGKEAADKIDTQLFIEMNENYKKLYNINRWENEATRLRKQLEAPLNPQYLINRKKKRPITK